MKRETRGDWCVRCVCTHLHAFQQPHPYSISLIPTIYVSFLPFFSASLARSLASSLAVSLSRCLALTFARCLARCLSPTP